MRTRVIERGFDLKERSEYSIPRNTILPWNTTHTKDPMQRHSFYLFFNDKSVPVNLVHLCCMKDRLWSVYTYHRIILTCSIVKRAGDRITAVAVKSDIILLQVDFSPSFLKRPNFLFICRKAWQRLCKSLYSIMEKWPTQHDEQMHSVD